MLRRLPNSDLLLSPLRLQEAVLSSRIEGTFATMGEVLKAEAGQPPERESKRQDIEEILNYRSALDYAMRALNDRPFNLSLMLQLHRILLSSGRGRNKAPGEFRKQQNYIGSRIDGKDTIRFVPPEWMQLGSALDNWEKYYHSEEEPLVRLALVHAQFEFLHPFLDGNGRIGRILIPIFLCEKDLLSHPTFYLSEYLERNRDEYMDRLNDLGKKKLSWRNWTEFFLNAIESQANQNIKAAESILELYERLKSKFISITKSRYAVPLLDAAFELQYFQASQLQWKGGAPSKPTLMTMLNALEQDRVIRVHRGASGRVPAIWWLPELSQLVDRDS